LSVIAGSNNVYFCEWISVSLKSARGEGMGHPLLDLTGKTAVVIGGTSGIGFALSRELARAGAD
jgi:hypothetical protein